MKVSVIVPVGNRAGYAECKKSILHSLELEGAKKCEWELVEMFDDEHRGVSWARNEGLRRASGEYIAWVDDDDVVTEDWAATICEGLESCPDVLSFNAIVEWQDSSRSGYCVGGEANAVDVMSERTNSQLWNKVVRRELFDGLVFKGAVHEDYRLLCELLPKAGAFTHIPKTLYEYRRRRNGASQFPDAESACEALIGLVEMCEKASPVHRREMRKGVAMRIADFCINAKGTRPLRRFILMCLPGMMIDRRISAMVKGKCILAALGFSRRSMAA